MALSIRPPAAAIVPLALLGLKCRLRSAPCCPTCSAAWPARSDADTQLPDEDQRIAVAALLVIAAHAAHDYADVERAQIERVLADRYGLSAEAAAKLRADGEEAEHASVDLYRFTSLVKAGIPHEERASVIEAMWRVVLSDSHREQHEDALMRRVTDLLGLDPRESVEARRRVQAAT